jgi:Domain of unknown function (DUF4150)
MSSHITVNDLGLTYKSTVGLSTATIPDVCKTPTPGGPVPLPYPNIADQGSLDKGTTTVKAKGKMIAIKGSEYSMSSGDEPGTVGGVTSNTFKKETAWITYSFDVKMDGENACRHTDKKFHNHKNTVDLAGNIDPALIKKFEKVLCRFLNECTEANDGGATPSKEWCDAPGSEPGKTNAMERGSAIDKCVEDKINDVKARSPTDFSKEVHAQQEVPVPGWGGICKPDVIVGTPPMCNAVYDIKTSCPPNKPPPRWPIYGDGTGMTRKVQNPSWHGNSQADVYHKACGTKPKIIHKNSPECKS